MHSIVTTFRGAVIKVEVANFCAAMDTLIDQDGGRLAWWLLACLCCDRVYVCDTGLTSMHQLLMGLGQDSSSYIGTARIGES